jgi:uncharacterized membrane-anchored protein
VPAENPESNFKALAWIVSNRPSAMIDLASAALLVIWPLADKPVSIESVIKKDKSIFMYK